MFLVRWFNHPNIGPEVKKHNFLFVQIDAIGIGLANAAAPFLPVFLTRLGATNFQVGLLTAMPALTGLVLAILIGRLFTDQNKYSEILQRCPAFSGVRICPYWFGSVLFPKRYPHLCNTWDLGCGDLASNRGEYSFQCCYEPGCRP